MGIATHLGPWLLGTVKNTTGTTPGTIRNIGATTVGQTSGTVVFNTTTGTNTNLFVLPAGAFIYNFIFDVTTAFNAATTNTLTVKIGTTTMTAAANVASPGRVAGVAAATGITLTSPSFMNVGATDQQVFVTYDFTGAVPSAGACTITCLYAVRNPDGTYAPTSFTGP